MTTNEISYKLSLSNQKIDTMTDLFEANFRTLVLSNNNVVLNYPINTTFSTVLIGGLDTGGTLSIVSDPDNKFNLVNGNELQLDNTVTIIATHYLTIRYTVNGEYTDFVRYVNVIGGLEVANGGTGRITLDSNRFLEGNGVSPVITTKVIPNGVVIGDTDLQTLTNKTLISNTNNVIGRELFVNNGSNSVSTYESTGPTIGQILQANSTSTAIWKTVTYKLQNTIVVSDFTTGNTTIFGANIMGRVLYDLINYSAFTIRTCRIWSLGGTNPTQYRLYDLTNGVELGQVTSTAAFGIPELLSFNFIAPTTNALMEIDARRTVGGSTGATTRSVIIEYGANII